MLSFLANSIRLVSLPIVAAMLALMAASLLAISASEQASAKAQAQEAARLAAKYPDQPAPVAKPLTYGYTGKQALFCAVAIVGFILAAAIPYPRLGRTAYLWFGLTLALLVLVLLLPANRFVHRWINLRFSGGPSESSILQFQPSELAKIAYVMALAWYLRYRDNYRRLLGLIPPFVLTMAPVALILLEPDLGTSLLLPPTLFFMLFMAGAKLRHLLTIVAVAALLVLVPIPQQTAGMKPELAKDRQALAYWQGSVGSQQYVLSPGAAAFIREHHQLVRIIGWLHQGDSAVSQDISFQLDQSVLALGAGGLSGRGDEDAGDFVLYVLPEDHTDFIYAVIGSKWGFVGCMAVMLIYLVIFVCGAEIAGTTDDPFGRLLVVGVLALLFTQIFINAGMTMGLMPITGMTLPLISYGGSSMLINGIALGLLANVARRRSMVLAPKPFEFGHRKKEPALPVPEK